MKKVLIAVAVLIAAAACGGAATSDTGAPAPQHQSNYGSLGAGGGAITQPPKGGTVTGPSLPAPPPVPVLQGPPVIRQAQLSITVDSGAFDNKLSAVRTLVGAQGGYIAGTDAQAQPGSGDQPSTIRTGTINFMVPAANFDTTIDQLSRVGKVQSERITGTDVSAQYVDLNARLANAEAQRDAMLALLKQATNINDIINVQNQIGQITGQIEELKGQIKYLDDNTAYSSVSVTLTESGVAASTRSDSWGFATALNDSAHNFVATINYFVAGLGAVGPFLVLAGLGYLLWRRRRSPQPRPA